jgi:aspartyl-tRNA(Asn)/glutamyl-tRNA(Gln) amidotransferase subunit B
MSFVESGVRADHVAELINLITSQVILSTAVAQVSSSMVQTRFTTAPAVIVEREGLKAAPTNLGELEQWCRDAIAGNPKALADFKGGKDSAINGFKGPVMKAAKGKADPKLVDETLRRLLAQM